jgi:hypothetical protein
MLGRLILILVLAAGIFWFLRWFARTPPQDVARTLKRGALYGLAGLLAILAATGHLNWLFAVAAAVLALAQRAFNLLSLLPLLRRLQSLLGIGSLGGGGQPPPDSGSERTSSIETRFLRMSLDHGSGQMQGTVLEGEYRGRRLSQLSLEQQLHLLRECRAADPQSTALLEAYLDRTRGPSWRQREDAEADRTGAPPPPGGDGPMSRDQAYRVLGLEPGADDEAIRRAHKRLMQKLHPDRDGSTFLATMINEAKRVLLG